MRLPRIYISSIAASFILVLAVSCEKEPEGPTGPNEPDIPKDTLVITNWIWEGLNDVYLWEQHLPDLDPDLQEDPEEYFYDLLYYKDNDSWIVRDYDALVALFSGVQLSTGISARPGYIDDEQTIVVSIVEYVSPGSPAADSGVVRGDIIYEIDGQGLDGDNYYTLFNQETATFEFGSWNGTSVVPKDKEITLTAIELNQNPVVHSEVIDYQGKKIGYIVYTQFTRGENDEWQAELDRVFEEFKTAAVSDVVFDLRYNGGGSMDLCGYIGSTLAPSSAMENEEIFASMIWNEFYNEFWMEYDMDGDGLKDGANSEQLVVRLRQADYNLNLQKAYFLTTDGTASASEQLMIGLYPYMDVVQIGEKTYGKCYASVTIDDWNTPKRHNWAMQPLVLKFANANGFTDFVIGISPDFEVEDRLLYAKPFGDPEDPMLAKALEEITGVAPAAKKSIRPGEAQFKGLPRPVKHIPEIMMNWPNEAVREYRNK